MLGLSLIGRVIGKYAAKYGIKKFFAPSLEITEVTFFPIRRSQDGIGEAAAAVFVAKVENKGIKAAEGCRPNLELDGVFEVENTATLAENFPFQKHEMEVSTIEYYLNSQVFWSDTTNHDHHFRGTPEADTVPERSISSGDSAMFTFALYVAPSQHEDSAKLFFPKKSGFRPAAVPEIKLDGTPFRPSNAVEGGLAFYVDQMKEFFWKDAKLYVTAENTGRVGSEIEFSYLSDSSFNIELRED